LVERLLREPERSGNTYLFFSRLLLEELRPVTAQYYLNAFYLICALAAREPDAKIFLLSSLRESSSEHTSAKELFQRWADLLLDHLRARPELRMLWAVESLAGRMAKRFLVYADRGSFGKMADFERYSFPEEAMAWLRPSAGRNLMTCVTGARLMILTSFLREAYVEKSRTWKPAVAHEQWLRLRASEEALEQATPDYPSLVRGGNFDWDLGTTDLRYPNMVPKSAS
jgi:hypothetical protein